MHRRATARSPEVLGIKDSAVHMLGQITRPYNSPNSTTKPHAIVGAPICPLGKSLNKDHPYLFVGAQRPTRGHQQGVPLQIRNTTGSSARIRHPGRLSQAAQAARGRCASPPANRRAARAASRVAHSIRTPDVDDQGCALRTSPRTRGRTRRTCRAGACSNPSGHSGCNAAAPYRRSPCWSANDGRNAISGMPFPPRP